MDLEVINKLYLELSQFATAKTNREIVLESALRGLYEHTADYICVNKAGGIHPTNRARQAARDALGMPNTYGMRHGVDCRKIIHNIEEEYYHFSDDDAPYKRDGIEYCGRCHMAL